MSNKKLIGFNEEEFREKVNPINQELVEDFLSQNHLSGQTLKQYKSALYIFCTWVHDNCKNKSIPELRPRDARKYQDWLIAKGLSPSAIKFKRSAVSSLCGFIEVYYDKEYDNFRNIYTKLTTSGSFEQFGKAATIIHIHFKIKNSLIRRQIGQIGRI